MTKNFPIEIQDFFQSFHSNGNLLPFRVKQNPKAEESVLGSNYVELLTEAILYWGRVYGTENKPKVMLKAMSDQLLKVTEVTGEEYYINKDFKAMDQKTLQKFEYIPFRSLPKNTRKAEKKKQDETIRNQTEDQIKQQPQPRPSAGGNSQSKQILRELDQKLEMYEYSKTMLKECIIENEQENEDINEVIDFLLQEVTNSYNNEVGKYLEPVLESDHPEKENYLKIILKEGETVEELNRLRANHKQSNIGYKEFTQRSLVLLGRNVEEVPIPTPIPNQVVEEEIKYAPELPVVKGDAQEFFATSLLDDKETPRMKPQQVDFQEFLAHSLLDDEETPRMKPKEDPIPITATSTKFKKLNLSRDTANKGVVPKFKAGDLEDDKNTRVDRITNPIPTPMSTPKKESKPSRLNQSEKLSPEKEFAMDKLGQSMRSSKVRMESLLNMENSIKKSYINSGKQPPNFKGLDPNSKLENEIVKLRKQKDELNKQNAILKNKSGDVVYVAEEPSPDQEKEVNSLKLLLADYQNRIDDIQRQLEVASATKVTSPAFSASPQIISEGNRDLDRELANLHKEVNTLRRSINTPLRLTSDFNKDQRDSIDNLEQQRSQSVMQGRYLSIQPFTSRERDDSRERILLSKANYSFNTERESFTTRDKKSQLDQFMSSPQTFRWEEMYERTSVKRNQYFSESRQSEKPECYRNNLFAPLKLRLKDTMESPHLVHNFKLNCLKKSGGVLFENNDLQVSISVNNVNSLSFSPQSLQFTLVYCNKTRNLISDMTAEFVELNQASFFQVPEVYKSTIPGEYELRQQVVFTFAEWSLQVPQICASYKNLKGRKDVDIFLPILITQFLEYKPTTLDSFSTLFNQADNIVVEGDETYLDSTIIKSNTDFSKYLENLIILNPLQNKGEDTVFGAVLRTKWQISSYFLKINITPSKKVRFTVSTHVENETFVDVILETFQFLFGRD